MAWLHAGFTEMPIVEHGDGEIFRLLDTNGDKTTKAHQLLAITRYHKHRTRWLRERQTQAHQGGATHGTPKIEIGVVIACGERVVS